MESTETKPETVLPNYLQAYYKMAKIMLLLLEKLMPPGVHMTLLARWPDESDGNPIVLSTDDLQQVEKTFHTINSPDSKNDYKIMYADPAMNGRPN